MYGLHESLAYAQVCEAIGDGRGGEGKRGEGRGQGGGEGREKVRKRLRGESQLIDFFMILLILAVSDYFFLLSSLFPIGMLC